MKDQAPSNKERAINAIREILSSPEKAEHLGKKLTDAHDLLSTALSECESPEETISLSIALEDIESLEKLLAGKGQLRELTEDERKELKSIADSLDIELGNMESLVDVASLESEIGVFASTRKAKIKSLKGKISENGIAEGFRDDVRSLVLDTKSVGDKFADVNSKVSEYFGGASAIPKEVTEVLVGLASKLEKFDEENIKWENVLACEVLNENFGDEVALENLIRLLENLIRFREKYGEALKANLPKAVKDLLNARLNDIDWTLEAVGIKVPSVEEQFVSAEEAEEYVADLYSHIDQLSREELSEEFSFIATSLLADGDSTTNKMPENGEFYDKLIALGDKLAALSSKEPDSADKAQFLAVMGGLKIVRSNIEWSNRYYQGMAILRVVRDDVTYDRKDRVGPTIDNVALSPLGTIDEVDALEARIRFDGEENWHDLAEFEDGNCRVVHGPPSMMRENYEPYSSDLMDEGLQEFSYAKKLTVIAGLEDLLEERSIKLENIPQNSLLRLFIAKYWIELKDGKIKFNVSEIPEHYMTDLAELLAQQVQIEELCDAEQQLLSLNEGERDSFYESRLLYIKALKISGSENEDKAKAALLEFYYSVVYVKDLPKELIEARTQALDALKALSLKALSRLEFAANNMFGRDEKYHDFCNGLLGAIEKQKQSIVDGDGFQLSKLSLTVKHGLEYSPTPGDKAVNAASLEVAPKVSARSQMQMAEKFRRDSAALNMEVLEHTPKQGALDLWNQLVALESLGAYGDMAALSNETELRSKRLEIASNLRNREGEESFLRTGFDSVKEQGVSGHFLDVAGVYYRQALQDDRAKVEAGLMELREQNRAKIEAGKDQFLKRAKEKLVAEIGNLERGKLLINGRVPSEAEFNAYKEAALSESTLHAQCEQLMNAELESQMEAIVFEQFEKNPNALSGQGRMAWSQLESMEGIFDSIDDSWKNFWEDLARTAVVMAASAMVGNWAQAGVTSLLGMAAIGSQWAESGKLGYDAMMFASKVGGFTLAEKSIMSVAFRENTWGTFGKDLLWNGLMFASVEGAQVLWRRVLGKELTYATPKARILFAMPEQQKRIYAEAYLKAGRLGKVARSSLDAFGSIGTEFGTFHSLSLASHMLFDGAEHGELDHGRMALQNIFAVLSLRASALVSEPLMRPINARIEAKRIATIENANPARFLENRGLANSFFAEGSNPRAAMEEVRAIESRHNIEPGFFAGRSLQEIRTTDAALRDFMPSSVLGKLKSAPGAEELMTLFSKDQAAFDIVASKMRRLPLTIENLKTIAEVNPEVLLKYADKLSATREEMINSPMFKEFTDAIRSLGIFESSAAASEFIDSFVVQMRTAPKALVFAMTLLYAGSASAQAIGDRIQNSHVAQAIASGGFHELYQKGIEAIPAGFLGGGDYFSAIFSILFMGSGIVSWYVRRPEPDYHPIKVTPDGYRLKIGVKPPVPPSMFEAKFWLKAPFDLPAWVLTETVLRLRRLRAWRQVHNADKLSDSKGAISADFKPKATKSLFEKKVTLKDLFAHLQDPRFNMLDQIVKLRDPKALENLIDAYTANVENLAAAFPGKPKAITEYIKEVKARFADLKHAVTGINSLYSSNSGELKELEVAHAKAKKKVEGIKEKLRQANDELSTASTPSAKTDATTKVDTLKDELATAKTNQTAAARSLNKQKKLGANPEKLKQAIKDFNTAEEALAKALKPKSLSPAPRQLGAKKPIGAETPAERDKAEAALGKNIRRIMLALSVLAAGVRTTQLIYSEPSTSESSETATEVTEDTQEAREKLVEKFEQQCRQLGSGEGCKDGVADAKYLQAIRDGQYVWGAEGGGRPDWHWTTDSKDYRQELLKQSGDSSTEAAESTNENINPKEERKEKEGAYRYELVGEGIVRVDD